VVGLASGAETYLFLISLVYAHLLNGSEVEGEEPVMAKQTPTQPTLAEPLLEILTDDEIHRALVRHVLMRAQREGQIDIGDPDAFLVDNKVEARVRYRDLPGKDPDTRTIWAAVSIDRAVSKQAPKTTPQTSKAPPPDSQGATE
jgi:hypothetical protein